jgi:hypothetical protein
MKKNKLNPDRKERKLTQLLNTHNEFMTFSSYYLWFLIDTCHFIIDDIKEIYVFDKHRAFNTFVTEFMTKRQLAKLNKDDAMDLFYKICLNGSYGFDIINEEHYTKSRLLDKSKTFIQQLAPNFVSTKKLNEDTYQVQLLPKYYGCNTSIVQGFFTLDNAKFWYLNFIYNFVYKCLDMSRIHFIEGDTDSMYWAVSGNLDESYQQGFKYVIKDEKFYNDNIYKFAPSSFYSTNHNNPTFNTTFERVQFDKKLCGLEIEKHCECMIALAPKMYTCFNSNKTVGVKSKGVNGRQNKLDKEDFKTVYENKNIKKGYNTNLQLHGGIMSKIKVNKNILTAAHTKYKVSSDFSTCLPLYL